MNRSHFAPRIFSAGIPILLGCLLPTVFCPPTLAASRPHIVVFLCDDHGYLDSTVYGATDVRTPRMQQLADGGLVFTHAFIASPACAPSRAALLSGLLPARNGAEANHTYARAGTRSLIRMLRDVGYTTAAFGKVAHGADVARWGFDRFDQKYDLGTVREYVRRHASDRPLCLFVGTHDPHVPWTRNQEYDPAAVQLPPTFVDTPGTREYRTDYYTEITRADGDLGTLHDLVRQQLGTNVLFVFTSDHGAQWPFGKWNLYDASIRTPLIMAWPGVLKPGSRTDAMVSWVDLLPTFLELAGGTPPPDLDGRSFAGILFGRTQVHRPEIFTTHSGDGRMNVYPIRSVRTPQFKYILNLYPQYKHTTWIDLAKDVDGVYYWRGWVAAARTNPAAAQVLQRYHQRPQEELYQVGGDPFETNNLATEPEFRGHLRRLRATLETWMTEQGDTRQLFREPRLLSEPEFVETPEGAPEHTRAAAPPKPTGPARRP